MHSNLGLIFCDLSHWVTLVRRVADVQNQDNRVNSPYHRETCDHEMFYSCILTFTDKAKVHGARDGVGLVDSSTLMVTTRTVAVYIREDCLMTTY